MDEHLERITILNRRLISVARRNFCLITFNWLANALVYNGLSFYSANLNVSSHLVKYTFVFMNSIEYFYIDEFSRICIRHIFSNLTLALARVTNP